MRKEKISKTTKIKTEINFRKLYFGMYKQNNDPLIRAILKKTKSKQKSGPNRNTNAKYISLQQHTSLFIRMSPKSFFIHFGQLTFKIFAFG